MSIVQANVPQAHLATAMGNPNQLLIEYSTDILLPVPGPYLVGRLRRHFLHGLLELNQFMIFVSDARRYMAKGDTFALSATKEQFVDLKEQDRTYYGMSMSKAAREALAAQPQLRARSRDAAITERIRKTVVSEKESILNRLAYPNIILRELFEASVIQQTPTLFSRSFAKARTFNGQLASVLRTMLSRHKGLVPATTTNTIDELFDQVTEIADGQQDDFLIKEFHSISPQTKNLLVQWLVIYHLQKAPLAETPFFVDLTPIFGFTPGFFVREWAFNRRERMVLVFGTPDLRGPMAADPVPPQGMLRREEYAASSNELTMLTAEGRQTTTREALGISAESFRSALDTVYFSGSGSVNQLTSQASNTLLAEERRNVVLSLISEISESRQNVTANVVTSNSATTTVVEAPGVDQRLSATHHRFMVVSPVTATVEMYDVGLTWSPRIFNPFYNLRQAVRNAYIEARDSHLLQYYVAEPVTPPIVFESYDVGDNLYLKSRDDAARVQKSFTIQLEITDRMDRPDFVNAYADFTQKRGDFLNDSDAWTVGFTIDSYSGGTIRGRVFVEMEDEDHWRGYVNITIPVLRYKQDTVNALANYELALRDYELKRQALNAQANQYAKIKQREFIERHERLTVLNKIVFNALIRRICMPTFSAHISYYKEVLSCCIDWSNVKIEFEPARMNSLEFPEFPADHFVNSPAVRFFLPVIHTAEDTFFDTLTACGTFQVRASVTNAKNKIDAARTRLANNGPDQIDQFSTEIVLGEHIEAVMSNYEYGS